MNKTPSSPRRIPPILLLFAIVGFLLSGLALPAQAEATSLPSGITHHWKLDEGSGTTAADSVGNADGTIASPDWTRKAQDGSSVLKFDGSNTVVEFASGVSMPSGNWSFAAVFAIDRGEYRDDELFKGRRVLFFGDIDGGGSISLFVDDNSGVDRLGFVLRVRDAADAITKIQVEANRYYQLPVVVQGGFRSSDGTLYLRVNRKEVTTTGADVGTDPTTPVFYLGRNDGSLPKFKGWAADVVWWDGKFLSSSERDDVYASLITRINGSDPLSGITVTKNDSQISFTAHATPYNGEHVQETASLYTSLWTTADNIYVSAPVNDGSDRSKVARLNKSYTSQENVIIDTSGHDSSAGHRGSSVAVDPNGTVVVHPSAHEESAQYQHTTTDEDLSTLTATPDPSDGDLRADYRRFFPDSVNSVLYGVFRGNGADDSTTIKWDDVNKDWDVVGNAPFTGFGGDADYGGDMVVASDGTLYRAIERRQNTQGFPRTGLGVVKSTDGGATWTDLEGNSITMPVDKIEYTYAMPRTVLTGTGNVNHDAVFANLLLDSNDNPMVVALWENSLEGDTERALWMARWNSTGGYFTVHRLDTSPTAGDDIGTPTVGTAGSKQFIIYIDDDFRNDPNWPSDPFTATRTPTMYILVTSDGGDNWTRYVLDDGTGYGADSAHFNGAHIDPRAFDVDGVQRITPLSLDNADLHEIWEFTLPVAASGGRLSPPASPEGGFEASIFPSTGESGSPGEGQEEDQPLTTTSPWVTLSFEKGADTTKMAVSNNPKVDDAPIERYQDSKE